MDRAVDHASVTLIRFILDAAKADGADPALLIRQSRLPSWMLCADDARIPMPLVLRFLQVVERSLDHPDAMLGLVGRHYAFGALGLYDYLFTTSASLGEGLEVSGRFMDAVATGSRLEVAAETERELTLVYDFTSSQGPSREIATQFAFGVFCARLRCGTARRIGPVHVGLAQVPPRYHDTFLRSYGTSAVDFGQEVNSMTIRKADLAIPLPSADRNLAAVLRRHAAALPPPPDRATTWYDRLSEIADVCLDEGTTSLTTAAKRLSLSPRTLQRRLSAFDTTWRSELDAARRRRERLLASDPDLAQKLGYSDPRAFRRARRRWNSTPPE
jgi:AraC-like DNA-binding protein